MPADFTNFNQTVSDIVAAVRAAKGTQASAKTLIEKFEALAAAKVTEALTADNAADQGSIDAAVAAITAAKDELVTSSQELGAAIEANSGSNSGSGSTAGGGEEPPPSGGGQPPVG